MGHVSLGYEFTGNRLWHNPSPRKLFARDLERHGCASGDMRRSVLHIRYDVSTVVAVPRTLFITPLPLLLDWTSQRITTICFICCRSRAKWLLVVDFDIVGIYLYKYWPHPISIEKIKQKLPLKNQKHFGQGSFSVVALWSNWIVLLFHSPSIYI